MSMSIFRLINSSLTKLITRKLDGRIMNGATEGEHLNLMGSSKQTKTSLSMPYLVGHDKKIQEFYIKLSEDGKVSEEKAVLQYSFVRKGIVDLEQTEVPPLFWGRGIAKILARCKIKGIVTRMSPASDKMEQLEMASKVESKSLTTNRSQIMYVKTRVGLLIIRTRDQFINKALDYFIKENISMKLSCTYLQKYVRENPLPQYLEKIVSS